MAEWGAVLADELEKMKAEGILWSPFMDAFARLRPYQGARWYSAQEEDQGRVREIEGLREELLEWVTGRAPEDLKGILRFGDTELLSGVIARHPCMDVKEVKMLEHGPARRFQRTRLIREAVRSGSLTQDALEYVEKTAARGVRGGLRAHLLPWRWTPGPGEGGGILWEIASQGHPLSERAISHLRHRLRRDLSPGSRDDRLSRPDAALRALASQEDKVSMDEVKEFAESCANVYHDTAGVSSAALAVLSRTDSGPEEARWSLERVRNLTVPRERSRLLKHLCEECGDLRKIVVEVGEPVERTTLVDAAPDTGEASKAIMEMIEVISEGQSIYTNEGRKDGYWALHWLARRIRKPEDGAHLLDRIEDGSVRGVDHTRFGHLLDALLKNDALDQTSILHVVRNIDSWLPRASKTMVLNKIAESDSLRRRMVVRAQILQSDPSVATMRRMFRDLDPTDVAEWADLLSRNAPSSLAEEIRGLSREQFHSLPVDILVNFVLGSSSQVVREAGFERLDELGLDAPALDSPGRGVQTRGRAR